MRAPTLGRSGLFTLAFASACASQGNAPVHVSVEPGLIVPKDLLAQITSLGLKVFDTAAGADCSAMTASATGIPTFAGGGMPAPLDQTNLNTTGCTSGFKFCGTLTIPESKTDLVFAAVGKNSVGTTVASGCTRHSVGQTVLSVDITMVRNIPAAVCGDGTVEPKETCDPGKGTDALCMSCQTSEVLLSLPATSGGPSAGNPGDKVNPFFLWPPASDPSGYLFAFYGDKSAGSRQIAMRVFDNTMAPLPASTPLGKVEAGSFFLPNDPNTFPPKVETNDQLEPSAAVIGSKYYVAYEGDDGTASQGFDIHLRSMDSALSPDQVYDSPCVVNGNGNGEVGTQSLPQVAVGPGGALLVVWQDESLKAINGVTYTPMTSSSGCGALGVQQAISTGSSSSQPVVAGTPTGWVVAWTSGSDVKWRVLDMTGMPTAAEQPAGPHTGPQDHPAIAALGDGSFGVAWSDHSVPNATAIYAQRFLAGKTPITGDQAAKVNNLVAGNEVTPVMASTSAAGGAYVVAWVDSGAPNHVRARLLSGANGSLGDGSGYLFNTVTGLADEFQVSLAAGRTRANPTVVVGGSGPYVGFGWEDSSTPNPGIYGRRFPAPMP